jgi:uncharacterized membrane protein YdbT with pleckstrin-like domain
MRKLLDAFLADAAEQIQRPEIRDAILRPLLVSIFNVVYPYLLGAMLLWGIMFICVALILLILVRGTLLVGIQKA